MEKDQRRDVYSKKSTHNRKEKLNREEEAHLGEGLKEKIRLLDLKGLLQFMRNDFGNINCKQQKIENELNITIIRKVEELKSSWKAFHREILINYLHKFEIPFDPKLEYEKILASVNKNGSYYVRYYNSARPNADPIVFGNIVLINHNNSNKIFYGKLADSTLDFHIEFKRIEKDTIFLCQHFLALVEIVERETKMKWEPK